MTTEPVRIGALDPTEHDPDLVPPRPDEIETNLDGLLESLEKALVAPVSMKPVTLAIPMRPGVSFRCTTDLDDDTIKAFRKRSADRKDPDGVNSLRFCAILLAAKCEAILFKGQEPTDEAGQSLTFGHKRIRTLFGAERAADVVIKAFANDAHLQLAANELMERAGFGDEAVVVDDEEDPSGAS